eukprot:754694-Hanusia_phi.AAC.3
MMGVRGKDRCKGREARRAGEGIAVYTSEHEEVNGMSKLASPWHRCQSAGWPCRELAVGIEPRQRERRRT